MASPYHRPPRDSGLRQRAETALRLSPLDLARMSVAEVQHLVYELQVHQVELELQNEELRQAQLAFERMRGLYDRAPVGYLSLDERTVIVEANQTVAMLLGVAKTSLHGKRLASFVARTDTDTLYRHYQHVRATDTKQVCELRLGSQTESPRDVRLESIPVQPSPEAATQYRTALVDITEQKQAAMTLRQVERLSALGTFAAGMAHELNNPLGAIVANAEHARSVLTRPEAHDVGYACLTDILADAQRCAQIVKRVLHFARQGHAEKVSTELHPLIQAARDLTLHYAEQHGVHLSLSLAPARPSILANAPAMELVFANLIRNAVEAGEEGAHVSLRTEVEARRARILVQDNGVGLSEAEQQRMFDPFYTTRAGGTGLGLSITHRIITDHNGTITFQSLPGRGTTVCVCLPLTPAAVISLA